MTTTSPVMELFAQRACHVLYTEIGSRIREIDFWCGCHLEDGAPAWWSVCVHRGLTEGALAVGGRTVDECLVALRVLASSGVLECAEF